MTRRGVFAMLDLPFRWRVLAVAADGREWGDATGLAAPAVPGLPGDTDSAARVDRTEAALEQLPGSSPRTWCFAVSA